MLFGLSLSANVAAETPVKHEPSVQNVFWMVDCILKRDRTALDDYLRKIPGEQGSEFPWIMAAIGPCLVEDRPVPAASFYKRGAYAEARLKREFLGFGKSAQFKTARIFKVPTDAETAEMEPTSLRYLAMLNTASCVTRTNPDLVWSTLQTRPGSDEEQSAVERLIPTLSTCIDQGSELKFTTPIVRAFLGEAGYRHAINSIPYNGTAS